jgi:hypothetical protein
VTITGFTDDLDVIDIFHQGTDTFTNDAVIIDHQDTNG